MATSRRPRAKRQRLQTDERRLQLLELGLREFSSHSYDDVNLDDVARRAGISKGLLFHYFPTKRAFYTETVRVAQRELLAATELPAEMPPLQRLTQGLEAYLRYVGDRAQAYVALFRGGIGSDTRIAEIVQETREEFARRATDGLRESGAVPAVTPALELAIRGWIGFVEATSVGWAEQKRMSAEALRDLQIQVLMATVAAAARTGEAT